jgi:putative flavoprotein involved in K+ transport
VADYLEAHAARFQLPVRTSTRVDQLSREGDRYVVVAGDRRWEADHVVVASGAYQRSRIPAFAANLDPSIVQLDAGRYRNPSRLADGGVLVVGAGNTGAEIALEAAGAGRLVWLSGRDTGEESPFRVGGVADRLLTPPFWFVISRVLTVDTRIGGKLRHKGQSMGWPLVRVKHSDLTAAGIGRVPRTVGVRDGRPMLEDGRALEVTNVVWCTGFASDFSWINLPVLGDDDRPAHDRGVVASQPGLYFVGLFFLSALTSSLLGGVGADARHIAEHITNSQSSRPAATPERVGRRR